ASSNLLKAERDGLDARRTSLVHRVGWNFLWNAAADGNLPRGIWTASRLAGVAEDRLFNLLRLPSGAFERCLRGDHAHISGGERGERASKLADGRADGGEDVHVVHQSLPDISV